MIRSYTNHVFFLFILILSVVLIQPAAAIPAFLPHMDTVPEGQPMAIDGVWKVSAINKKVRYEAGRVYAVDDWYHLLVLHIQPGMVVQKNVAQSAPGTYVSDDLPMMTHSSATLQPNGRLKYTAGVFSSELVPVELDYPELMDEELQKLGGGGHAGDPDPRPGPQPDPTPSDCTHWAIDPETNRPVCLD